MMDELCAIIVYNFEKKSDGGQATYTVVPHLFSGKELGDTEAL